VTGISHLMYIKRIGAAVLSVGASPIKLAAIFFVILLLSHEDSSSPGPRRLP
jgi:hypothetical protein